MNFKKRFVAAAAALALGALASAYEWSECWKNYGGGIEEGNFVLNAGVGIDGVPLYGIGFPVELRAEYMKKIWVLPFGFGGYAGFSAHSYENKNPVTNDKSKVYWNDLWLGGLANYHFQFPVERLDVYTGIRLGVNIVFQGTDVPNVKTDPLVNPFPDFAHTIGATWFFTDLFGLNLEFGLFSFYGKLSAAFKFQATPV